ncbi:MAG: sigma-54 interaction domain-containing protein [Bacillota bacterium]
MTSYSEWKNFINKSGIDSPCIDVEIFKAWSRCEKIGTNPLAELAEVIKNNEFSLSEPGQGLVNIINRYTTIVNSAADSAGALMVVGDANARILKVIGNTDPVKKYAHVNLKAGADWSETNIGNNFVGSAVATKKQALMEGLNHYCKLLHNFSGIGVPVVVSGKIIGVVGIAVPGNNPINDLHKQLCNEMARLISIEFQKEDITDNLNRDLSNHNFNTENIALYDFHNIVGKHAAINETIKLGIMAAKYDLPVLIMGESGTGKEVMAQAIHNNSIRRNRPFIAINCGAFPRDLINSELFGYVDGAFTGSKKGGYIGKFEAANKGTLFLDEIGDMPLELQITLLRVLQEKQITKVGDYKPIPIDVRIIAATNKDIVSEISWSGKFRSDLYYRLNAFTISMPALRERKEDILELAVYFLDEVKERHKDFKKIAIDNEAMQMLINYSWPGNVRELKNVVERAYYFSGGTDIITKDHLPHQFSSIKGSISIGMSTSLDKAECTAITTALENNKWNIKQTAEMLGVARSTLYRKINSYKIECKK